MSSYIEKLKDPRWQKKRLNVMQRDNFVCSQCGSDKTTLNVHHKYYKKNKQPWEYDDNALETLCEKCHKIKHIKKLNLDELMSIGIVDIDEVLGFIAGRFMASKEWGFGLHQQFIHANYSYIHGMASGLIMPEQADINDLINFVSEKRNK